MRKILVILLVVLFSSCTDLLNPLVGTVWYAEDETFDIWTQSMDYEEVYLEFIDKSQAKFWTGNKVIHGNYRMSDDLDWIYFENFGNIDSAFWSNSTIDVYYTNNGKRDTYVFYPLE